MSAPSLARAAAELLGGALADSRPLAGGDLSEIVCLTLGDGREAVAKRGPAPRIEAAMLAALAARGAPAPKVLAVADDLLVLERLPEHGRLDRAWPDLGAVLATLHRPTSEPYGWPDDYGFGQVRIENARSEDWSAFWAERRLLPQVAQLRPDLARRIEALARDLPSRVPQRPPAALLHGDLWVGNVLVADVRVSGLIDPACYHGHCEVDLAMLALFGRPSADFFASYGALEPGYAERSAIYQLWPALVHLRLFGRSYEGLVERLLSSAGA